MQYLILAIISSALVSTAMRLGENKIKNNMAMFMTNYILCAVLSVVYASGTMDLKSIGSASGVSMAVIFGIISGILYLACFVVLQQSIKKSGVVMSATFMKLGVLIPTIMAVVIFKEHPSIFQILGIVLAVIAIIIINFEKEAGAAPKYIGFLVFLLVVSGITDSTANIYEKLGNNDIQDFYLLFTFIAATVCAFFLWLKQHQGICIWDILFGLLVGLPNFYSARCLLMALHDIPAVIVYPVYSVLTIVVVTVVGILAFKEHLSRQKGIAMCVILGAIVLLNI